MGYTAESARLKSETKQFRSVTDERNDELAERKLHKT